MAPHCGYKEPMPSPPLPPRIELTGGPYSGSGGNGKRKTWQSAQASTATSKASGTFTNVLVFFCTALMVSLLIVLWQWQKAQERASAAERQADISGKLSDGVLTDLAVAREQAAKLDRERAQLVKMLGEAERLHASLRGELSVQQQQRAEDVAATNLTLAESTKTGQALQSELEKTSATLSTERSAAEQEATRADEELQKVEREAALLAQQRNAAEAKKRQTERANQELDQKAQSLNLENDRISADLVRLRGVINNEEILRNELNLRNIGLADEVNRLRATIRKLESTIHAMEKDQDNNKKRGQ